MKLNSNEIHIWSANLSIDEAQEAAYYALLNPIERIRAEQFKFQKDRVRFIAARGVLRKILSIYFNILPNEILIEIDAQGKPFVPIPLLNQPLEFNLSHSDEMAVYAIANCKVGIDIEKIRKKSHVGVIDKYFSEHEKTHLQQLPLEQQQIEFYKLWTQKEALVKAIGKGLFMSLSNLDEAAQSWLDCSLSIHSDYQAALAYQPPAKALLYFVYQHV